METYNEMVSLVTDYDKFGGIFMPAPDDGDQK
jgi:hypothetical protein